MVSRKARKTYPRVQALINKALETESFGDIAKKTGLTKDTVFRYSKGDGIPGEKNLTRLSEYFKIPVRWLIGEDTFGREEDLLIEKCDLDFQRYELTKIEVSIQMFLLKFDELITQPILVYHITKMIDYLKALAISTAAESYNKGHFEDVLGQAIKLDNKLKNVFDDQKIPAPLSTDEQETAKVTPGQKEQGRQPPDPEP